MAEETLNLKEVFQHGFSIFKKIESNDGPGNSKELQDWIVEAIDCLKRAIEMINDLALFSINEDLDEISTSNLRYLLVPGLLGDLYLKLCTGKRIEVVTISKAYLLNYLQRCKLYGLLHQDINLHSSETPSLLNEKSLEELASERQAKIARYKRMKVEEKQLQVLSNMLESESVANLDEELQRKYNILLLKNWINKAFENISSINSEIPILEHMAKIKDEQNIKENVETNEEQKKKQNKVFGAGYPSLPTMTQEEYFEKELREGKIVTEFSENKTSNDKQGEESEKEEMDCAEDEKYLEKLTKEREWDDWKDDHRRGWGNRENMG